MFEYLISMKQSEFRPIRELFRAVYFVHEPSGVLLFIRSFDTEMPNPDLVSGLITAINSFAATISKTASSDSLSSINMEEMRILYIRKGQLLSVAISRNINHTEEQAMLNYIAHEFYGTYKMYIENFSGNTKNFDNFQQKLDSFEDFINKYRFRDISDKMQALKSTQLTPLPLKPQSIHCSENLEKFVNFSL